MGNKSAPAAPDMSGMIELSEYGAELGFATAMEQLSWAREQWGQQQELIYSVLDVQMPIMMEQWEMSKTQWEDSRKDRARYEELFWPIEEDLIAEFENYASPERMELEAGRAGADVTRAFQAQRENAQRQLESYGIDPSQTRSQALDANMRAQEAAAQAGAENMARQRVEDTGRALRGEAINIGRGMPAQVAQSTALAQSGGQGAAGIGQGAIGGYSNAFGTAAGAMGSPTQWMGQGNQGISNAMSGMNSMYQNQLAGWNAQQANSPWNIALNAAGMGLGYFAAEGGAIDGPGGPKDDAIPAKLSDGEFVIPAEVVERKGTEFFDKLVSKTREDPVVQERYQQMHQQKALPPPPNASQGLPMPQERVGFANGGFANQAELDAWKSTHKFNPTKSGPVKVGSGPPKQFNNWVPQGGFANKAAMDQARQQYGRPEGGGGGSRMKGNWQPPAHTQYTPRQGSSSDWWAQIRDRYRGNFTGGEGGGTGFNAADFMKSRKDYRAWEDRMYAETEPEHRKKAREWMEANPGKTMEGTYDPNTWEHAAQLYGSRPERMSLGSMPMFQSMFQKYGISPPNTTRLK